MKTRSINPYQVELQSHCWRFRIRCCQRTDYHSIALIPFLRFGCQVQTILISKSVWQCFLIVSLLFEHFLATMDLIVNKLNNHPSIFCLTNSGASISKTYTLNLILCEQTIVNPVVSLESL